LSLETYAEPTALYRCRGDEVNPFRPFFTGDVFVDIAIPGVQDSGMGILVAHPCSMRGKRARLKERVLMASVTEHQLEPGPAWTSRHGGKVPLPELTPGAFHVAHLDEIGKSMTGALQTTTRLACLSAFGINLLQQRLVWRLTRYAVPTWKFQEAFAHTQEEADLLEDWNDELCPDGMSIEEAAEIFETFLRAELGGGRTLQGDLEDPQMRGPVRIACRNEARRLVEARGRPEGPPAGTFAARP